MQDKEKEDETTIKNNIIHCLVKKIIFIYQFIKKVIVYLDLFQYIKLIPG